MEPSPDYITVGETATIVTPSLGPRRNDKQVKKRKKTQIVEPGRPIWEENVPKYTRTKVKNINTKQPSVKKKAERDTQLLKDSIRNAARSEMLLLEEPGYLEADEGERTADYTQRDISKAVDIQSAAKIFDLNLDLGPYNAKYSRNGRSLVLAGRKGHLSLLQWQSKKLLTEFHVRETVRDVTFLHGEDMFAVAQKKYTYVYDSTGREIHCLKSHLHVNRLLFLPYHFLLVSTNDRGRLVYQDTSTGQLVSSFASRKGPCDTLAQNPANATVAMGHTNGTVTLWAPSSSQPLVTMLTHRGALRSIAFDREGRYMVTAGMDARIRLWDIRKFAELHVIPSYPPPSSMDISQLGVLALGFGSKVKMYRNPFSQAFPTEPYLQHLLPKIDVRNVAFCPFDDVLGIGHSQGFSSVIVPGAGEPNFDSAEANPFQDRKQRRELEVHQLLEKLSPDMIALDPNFVASVQTEEKERDKEKGKETSAQNKDESSPPPSDSEEEVDFFTTSSEGTKPLKIKKAKVDKSARKHLTKQQNFELSAREKKAQMLEAKNSQRLAKRKAEEAKRPPSVLNRFRSREFD